MGKVLLQVKTKSREQKISSQKKGHCSDSQFGFNQYASLRESERVKLETRAQ